MTTDRYLGASNSWASLTPRNNETPFQSIGYRYTSLESLIQSFVEFPRYIVYYTQIPNSIPGENKNIEGEIRCIGIDFQERTLYVNVGVYMYLPKEAQTRS